MCTRLLSDATLTRLIRPTRAHNSLYLKQAEREKLSLAGGTASPA
ncbi:flagellar L-ring FlgH domain protein [Escherichia coli 6-319-05_S4_C3]|nr:flagellar L-ring FlgH domain protein [Escherichia coli 6-319-05_S4_C3]